MLNLICLIIATIVFKGFNGTSLIIPIGILLYFVGEEIEDIQMMYKKVFRGEV